METSKIIGIIVALVFVAGGYYVFVAQDDAAMTDDSVAMIKEQEKRISDEELRVNGDALVEADDAMEADDMMDDKDMMSDEPGSYEAYDPAKIVRANEGRVVLFFHASWCPTCRAFKNDVSNNLENIPDGMTILEVNYDTETALKQKYGITYQHTYVEVDADGNALNTWSGSPTLEAFLREV